MLDTSYSIIVKNLENIFNKDSDEIAEVLKILNAQEKYVLKNRFGELFDKIRDPQSMKELTFKLDAIEALIFVLQNNPQVNNALKASISDTSGITTRDSVLKKLYSLSFELYKSLIETETEADPKKELSLWVLFALYGILADKQTISHLLIQEHLASNVQQTVSGANEEEKLEESVYKLILKLLGKFSSREQISELAELLVDAENLLANIQDSIMAAEDLIVDNAFIISSLANVLCLIKSVKTFLFTGKVPEEDGDVFSLIDNYCFNAIKLTENIEGIYLNKIAYLLRYGLRQLCLNSIWQITGKSPAIKKFFEECLHSKDHLIYTLFPSQRDAILDILTTKKSVVLNMPTSSGKTLLAQLYILFTLHNFRDPNQNPMVCYVVPTNALINQISRELQRDFKEFGYKVETVLPFYDIDPIENEFLTLEHIDIIVSTPEKLDFLVRNDHPVIKNLKLVVLDEAHNLSDKERGSKFELLLATLKQRRKDVNYLLLSPFITNSQMIAEWLGETERDSLSINIAWSPTKQYIGCNLLTNNKTKSIVQYLPSDRNNIIKESVEITVNTNVQVIKAAIKEQRIDYITRNIALIQKYIKLGTTMVLCEGAGSCERLAQIATKYLVSNNLLKNISADEDVSKVIELIKLEYDESHFLINCLINGVVYHHSKLPTLINDSIEQLIAKKDLIKLVCATTTLAQGMNFPITTVIFDVLSLPGHKLTNSEFWNIAGRAGRAYMDKEGHVITPYQTSQSHTKEACQEYIKGSINEVISSLGSFFNSVSENVIFDYNFIKNNPSASNFLQYINHILNVSYHYKLDSIDTNRIRNILNSSLVYRELSFQMGFLEAQQKISEFSLAYVNHLKGEDQRQLKKADSSGISDISYRTITGLVLALKKEIIEMVGNSRKDDFLKASKIILQSKDVISLARIINIIARIPEMKLQLFGHGNFNPESIAKIVIGWVNGRKVAEIAKEIQYENVSYEEILGRCFKYVNGNLKSYIPWGMSIYQTLTDDIDTGDGMNLPSYIYYGVKDKEAVILSKAGVPRFAINDVKELIKKYSPGIELSAKNLNNIKQSVKQIPEKEYSLLSKEPKIIKSIIDSNL